MTASSHNDKGVDIDIVPEPEPPEPLPVPVPPVPVPPKPPKPPVPVPPIPPIPPLPEPNPVVDKETLKKALKAVLGIGLMLTRLTPTTIDDTIILSLDRLTDQDWFIEAALYVITLVQQGRLHEVQKLFKHALGLAGVELPPVEGV